MITINLNKNNFDIEKVKQFIQFIFLDST